MEMGYCSEHAIPHSEWLKWDPEDRAKLVAYLVEDSLRCSMCGTAGWEWEENKFAYTAVDEFCKGCYQKAIFNEAESSSLPGTNAKLVPTTKIMSAKAKVKAKKREAMMRRDEAESGIGGHPSGERSPDRRHPAISAADGTVLGGNVGDGSVNRFPALQAGGAQ